jgi:hypothetical protein
MVENEDGRSYSGTAVAAVLIALMIAAAVYRYWPSDEREIRRHLSNLAEVLSVPAGESDVARLTRLAAMREYFAPDVRISVGSEQMVSREALVAMLNRAAAPAELGVEFVDVAIQLADDHRSAQVGLTAKVSTTDRQTGESTLDAREASVQMSKEDGDWVITSVESRETLAAPTPTPQ